MLNRHSCLGETVDHALAEFTIFPMYRRQHLGLEAARMLFLLSVMEEERRIIEDSNVDVEEE